MGYPEAQYAIDEILSRFNKETQTGLEPLPISLSIREVTGNRLAINWATEDIVYEGELLARLGGMILGYTIDDEVLDLPSQIVILKDIKRDEIFSHSTDAFYMNIPERYKTYRLKAFPYTDHNVMNYNSPVAQIYLGELNQIFGFHQDFTVLDPDETITYIGDCEGYSPMRTNVDEGVETTMGSWGDWWWLQQNKPFVVDSNGVAVYQLDENDGTKKATGETANPNDGLGVFAWLPRLYHKEIYSDDGNSRDVYFCKNKIDDSWIPLGFEDNNSTIIYEGIWFPIFYCGDTNRPTSDYGGGVVKFEISKPEAKAIGNYGVSSTVQIGSGSSSTYVARFFSGGAFVASGSRNLPYLVYDNFLKSLGIVHPQKTAFVNYPILNFIRDLLYLLGKSTNVQKHFGYGLSGVLSIGSVSYTQSTEDYSSTLGTTVFNNKYDNLTLPPCKYISNAPNTSGFYGSGRKKGKANKIFHSNVLGSYLAPIFTCGLCFSRKTHYNPTLDENNSKYLSSLSINYISYYLGYRNETFKDSNILFSGIGQKTSSWSDNYWGGNAVLYYNGYASKMVEIDPHFGSIPYFESTTIEHPSSRPTNQVVNSNPSSTNETGLTDYSYGTSPLGSDYNNCWFDPFVVPYYHNQYDSMSYLNSSEVGINKPDPQMLLEGYQNGPSSLAGFFMSASYSLNGRKVTVTDAATNTQKKAIPIGVLQSSALAGWTIVCLPNENYSPFNE